MLTLKVSNPLTGITDKEALILDASVISLTYETKSFKEPSVLKTPHSFSFKVPMVDNNIRILGMPHSPNTVNQKRYPASLEVDSPTLLFEGYLIVNNCKDSFYNVTFFGALGLLFQMLNTASDGKQTTLVDILPTNLLLKRISLSVDSMTRTWGEVAFHTKDGIKILGAALGLQGFDKQQATLKRDSEEIVLSDLSNRGSGTGQIPESWLVDSISGKFLPWQFGDFRTACIQPVLPFSTLFSWLTSWFRDRGYTFQANNNVTGYLNNYGVALPMFASLDENLFTKSPIGFEVLSGTSFRLGSGQGGLDFHFPSPNTVYGQCQMCFWFVGDDGSEIIAMRHYSDNWKDVAGLSDDVTFVEAGTSTTTSATTGDLLVNLPVKPGVTYTIRQFWNDGWNSPYGGYFLVYPLNPYDDQYDTCGPGQSIVPYTFDLHTYIGYWNGNRIESSPEPADMTITCQDYFMRCPSPYKLLVEFCKAFHCHIIENNYNLFLESDFTDSPSAGTNLPLSSVEITEMIPFVYQEHFLDFKMSACKDWFSDQYNSFFKDSPLGSYSLVTELNMGVENSDRKEYTKTEFKYSPYTRGTYANGNESPNFNIQWDKSGDIVDLEGAILKKSEHSITTIGLTLDVSDSPKILDWSYSDSTMRKNISGNYSFYGTFSDGSNGDSVSYGLPKYYPTVSQPNLYDSLLARSISYISRYLAMEYYNYNQGALVVSTPSVKSYYAKKVKLRGVMSGMLFPFRKYNLTNFGIIIPSKITMSLGKKDTVCTVEALVITTDPIN